MNKVETKRAESDLKFRILHLSLRLSALMVFLHLILSFYDPYFRFTLRHFRGGWDTYLMAGSSLILPIYVGLEAWWMRGHPAQRRALLIDISISVGWFVIFWAFVLHSFWRYAGSL